MKGRILRWLCVWVLASLAAAPALAQSGATSAISGTVVDNSGGAIPGVTVVARNEAGATFETVTNTEGVFSLPAMNAGTYTLTVSLAGFKTAVVSDVRVVPGTPASVKVTLEVGQLEETINVVSSSELINTQTATVSSTLNADQINRMPTPSRNALNAVTFLPGVNTPTTNRNSTINGLPESFINITLDGVANSDQFNKTTDGFFASVTPRQDAVEAVSVTTAVSGAELGGSGAASISFVTRSGTGRFSGSAYEYFRHWELNSNYWFNKRDGLPRNEIKLNQYGARAGGPIVIPGLIDGRDKAFFFANYEQLRFPNSFTRNRDVLHPRATEGWFRYSVGNQVREVNVLQLAAANGQISTIDPTVQGLLRNIAAATATTGVVTPQSDPLLMNYRWQSPGRLFEHQPTVRVDYNVTDNHRLSVSTSIIDTYRDPDYLNSADAQFPGAPNYERYDSLRPLYSATLRSTLGPNLVNELRGGTTRGGASYFGSHATNGAQTFESTGGYSIDFDANIGLENWHRSNAFSWRSGYSYSLENTLSWQRGTHSMTFGGAMLSSRSWENEQQVAPGINLRFDTTNDPARDLFSNVHFPSATAGQLADARDLYALLTGRVGGVTGTAALTPGGEYVAFGEIRRAGKVDVHSLFAQDSWRVTPGLTLNAGVRWDVQLPFTPSSSVMSTVSIADICGPSGLGDGGTYSRCAFYSRASGGKVPEYVALTGGTRGYNTDWNNFAPNLGVAWRPNVQGGWLRTLLGDPEQATLRAGFSMAYDRQGLGTFINVYDGNPGGTISLLRDASTGTPPLVGPGESWPVLLSQRERLVNASFPNSPQYPIQLRENRADDLNTFAPDIQIGYARTWTVSLQRSLSQDMAVDVRYVGTRGVNQWSTINYNNDFDLEGNGFIDEFRLAMANLQANNAAGGARAGSFAYFGPGSGTNPLPIYLAYLNGLPASRANDPAAYSGGTQTWRNTTLAQRLVVTNPLPETSASDLDGNLGRRQNALAAGLPANFFIVNPLVDDANVTDSGAYSDYHALQVELRRRLSKGLQANVSYQYAVEGGSAFLGFRYGRALNPAENVRHAIKTQWDWTLPFGRGQRFGSNLHPILEGLVGGWQFNGVGRIQARTINFGNVRLVGMTVDELTDAYKHEIRIDPATGLQTVYNLPQDIIDNTRRAFNVSVTSPTGYSALGVPEGRYFAPANSAECLQLKAGDCAPRTLLVRAPLFTRFDIGVTKRFPIRGQMNFELRVDVLNVFDNVNFNPFDPDLTNLNTVYAGSTFGQVTTAYQDPSNTFDPGGRLGQIMFRFNW